MASAESDVLKSVPTLCAFCGHNAVKKRVQCVVCEKWYHFSCAGKITGSDTSCFERDNGFACCNDIGEEVTPDGPNTDPGQLFQDNNQQDEEFNTNQLLKMIISENRDSRRILVGLSTIIHDLCDEKKTVKKLCEELNYLQEKVCVLEKMVRESKQCECQEKNSGVSDAGEAGNQHKPITSIDAVDRAPRNRRDSGAGTAVDIDKTAIGERPDDMVSDMTDKKTLMRKTNIKMQKRSKTKTYSELLKNDQDGQQLSSTHQKDEESKINSKGMKNKRIIIGTHEAGEDGNNLLEAGPRRSWIFLGKIRKGTKEENITKYVIGKLPDIEKDLVCTNLQSKGLCESFKIGFCRDHYETVMNPDFWPSGILVKPFLFRRRVGVEVT